MCHRYCTLRLLKWSAIKLTMKLSREFLKNVEAIADGLHGRPINTDWPTEWKVSVEHAMLLLEYLYKSGRVEIVWLPEQQQMCFVKPINNTIWNS